MHELHALPAQWESLGYSDFLAARRRLMAGIIRPGFETLQGRAAARFESAFRWRTGSQRVGRRLARRSTSPAVYP
jgi:hypothetical protein